MTTKFATCCAVAAALTAGLSGCAVKVGENGPPRYMSVGDLQSNVANGLSRAGSPPQSVTCRDGLLAGKTASCDVVFNGSNGIEAIATATGAAGNDVTYNLTPAMTKEQVEKTVAAMAAVPSATCDSGLDGILGATTRCVIQPDPAMVDPMLPLLPTGRVAEVVKVDPAKLGMDLSVFNLLPKQQVQDMMWQRLFGDGVPVDTIECVNDAVAKVGSGVDCVATLGDQRIGYVVTVAQVDGDNVTIDYRAKP